MLHLVFSDCTETTWCLPGDAEKEQLLQQIHEVLPGYGDGFLLACLDACGYNSERVIAHLLEGNLPCTYIFAVIHSMIQSSFTATHNASSVKKRTAQIHFAFVRLML